MLAMRPVLLRSKKGSWQKMTAFVLTMTLVMLLINCSHFSEHSINSSTFIPISSHDASSKVISGKKRSPRPTHSSQSTVMGFATGYELNIYKRFVGSLRNTGFKGNIILAVAPNLNPAIERYLLEQNVTIKRVEYTQCSTQLLNSRKVSNAKERELLSCVKPYNTLKARWGRFPL